MRPDTALYQLRTMPAAFLNHCLVVLVGATPSGVTPYFIEACGNAGGGEGFRITTVPTPCPIMGGVHAVRMIPSNEDVDLSAIEPYVLDNTGPDIMVTGQLSGCVFAIENIGGGQFVVAHIQPGGVRLAGAGLRQAIRQTGRFAGHGRVTQVFGVGDYTARAYVVGVRSGGVWRIYGQKVAAGNGPITGPAVQIV